MRQALKTNWQIELPEAHVDEPAPVATPAPVSSSATVLPFGAQRRGADHRAEVVEVLSALSRAADEIRHADGRAVQAENVSRDFAERLLTTEERARVAETRAEHLDEQLKVAEANLRLTERKFQQLSDWQAQQVAETEAELDRLRVAVELAQTRVVELEGAAVEQDGAMRAIIEDAGNRIFSAETRANDAVRDFEALRDFIKTNFVR